MHEITKIIQELPVKLWLTDEKLYSFSDFYEKLKNFSHSKIKCEDLIITPYYISKGKRLELYEFELIIMMAFN